jgi:hypothetical protein
MLQSIRTIAFVAAAAAAAPGYGAGKLVYEPLSTEADRLGRLAPYVEIERQQTDTLELGDLKLSARVPVRANAYDAVPIEFTLQGDPGPDERVAIEVTAFEDAQRRDGRDLYDLAIPGNMKIRIEYLGSQTGVFDPARVTRLTQTSRHEMFPPYRLEPFVRSATVKRGNYLFFKFRVTNVGDTILDAEGFGAWMAEPQAFAIAEDGERRHRANTINRYERHTEYLYPGESFEQWVSFFAPGVGLEHARTLPAGKYVIRYATAYRWNTEYNWIINMWGGKHWYALDVPIEVAERPSQTEVEPQEVELEDADTDRMCRYIGSLEEFMTSFRIFERDELASRQTGTIHIQVAPWTDHLVLKLIGNTPGRIKTLAIPIQVSQKSLAIRPNADNPFVVRRNGHAEPAFCTQNMAAMRAATQLGPTPEKHLRDRLAEQMACGVNVLCTTGGDWHQAEIHQPDAFVGDIHAETFKYYYDVLAREFHIPVFGWGVFPAKTAHVIGTGGTYWQQQFDIPFIGPCCTYSGRRELDVAHPDFPKAYAGTILFNYKRWGDLWYRTADGDVLIDVEDSWGWLRDDINVRYTLGPLALERFTQWLQRKYGDIETLNAAWNTHYQRFDEIDPQAATRAVSTCRTSVPSTTSPITRSTTGRRPSTTGIRSARSFAATSTSRFSPTSATRSPPRRSTSVPKAPSSPSPCRRTRTTLTFATFGTSSGGRPSSPTCCSAARSSSTTATTRHCPIPRANGGTCSASFERRASAGTTCRSSARRAIWSSTTGTGGTSRSTTTSRSRSVRACSTFSRPPIPCGASCGRRATAPACCGRTMSATAT